MAGADAILFTTNDPWGPSGGGATTTTGRARLNCWRAFTHACKAARPAVA